MSEVPMKARLGAELRIKLGCLYSQRRRGGEGETASDGERARD